MARWKLTDLVARLAKHHGKPRSAPLRDPWLLVLWENVAYLANDARRRAAFDLLRKSVGTKPEQILAAADAELRAVASHGILADTFVEKLRRSARLALEAFPDSAGDMKPLLKWPPAKALKALGRFPGLGRPGAEKILLFARAHATLALESNGLRVLTRVGFAPEQKSYSKTYRLVRAAAELELPAGFAALIEAHQLLRQHGQELCKHKAPRCGECPLRARCEHATA